MRLNAKDGGSRTQGEPDTLSPAGDPGQEQRQATARTHRLLDALAAAADPQHADDLVQDAWRHLLDDASPGATPTQEELLKHLFRDIRRHDHDHEVDREFWSNAMLGRGRTADKTVRRIAREGEPPTLDMYNAISARPLEHLDPDSERAELYLPDFYDDGPDIDSWVVHPSRWPTISHIVGPEAEFETSELYRELDAAIGDLPQLAWDAVHLVDLEGHTLETASWLLGVDREVALASLSAGRNHLRGRLDAYLSGERPR